MYVWKILDKEKEKINLTETYQLYTLSLPHPYYATFTGEKKNKTQSTIKSFSLNLVPTFFDQFFKIWNKLHFVFSIKNISV